MSMRMMSNLQQFVIIHRRCKTKKKFVLLHEKTLSSPFCLNLRVYARTIVLTHNMLVVCVVFSVSFLRIISTSRTVSLDRWRATIGCFASCSIM